MLPPFHVAVETTDRNNKFIWKTEKRVGKRKSEEMYYNLSRYSYSNLKGLI